MESENLIIPDRHVCHLGLGLSLGLGGKQTSAAAGGGGGGATWASIWAGQAHIFDLKADNVTLSSGNILTALNVGSADAMFKQQIANIAWTEEDADFNGLPSLTFGGLATMIARNEADSASKTDSDFIAATAGFFSILVKLTNEAGATSTTYTDLPGVVAFGNGSAGIAYAGSDQEIGAAAFSGGYKTAYSALARNTAALVTLVKTSTHIQTYINTTKAAETACGNISLFGGAVYVARSSGNDKITGKLGPWAGSTSVPEDLETRIAAACTLAGIS